MAHMLGGVGKDGMGKQIVLRIPNGEIAKPLKKLAVDEDCSYAAIAERLLTEGLRARGYEVPVKTEQVAR